MFEPKNVDLTDRLQAAIGCKRQSCRTYASQISRLWSDLNPGKKMPKSLKWLDQQKGADPHIEGSFPSPQKKHACGGPEWDAVVDLSSQTVKG